MAYVRKKLPASVGEGQLRYRGFQGQVAYEIMGEPTSLKAGPSRLRGAIVATPEVAQQAFKEGEGFLTLESGAQFRITLLGHSTGSDTAYFEMRV